MHVRVDQKTYGLRADFPDRRHHLVCDLCVLGIHHKDAIRANQHTDPAAGSVLMAWIGPSRTGEHIKVRSDLLGQDFNLVVVNSLPLYRGTQGNGDYGRNEGSQHDIAAHYLERLFRESFPRMWFTST